jgi:hypothetical protein
MIWAWPEVADLEDAAIRSLSEDDRVNFEFARKAGGTARENLTPAVEVEDRREYPMVVVSSRFDPLGGP